MTNLDCKASFTPEILVIKPALAAHISGGLGIQGIRAKSEINNALSGIGDSTAGGQSTIIKSYSSANF